MPHSRTESDTNKHTKAIIIVPGIMSSSVYAGSTFTVGSFTVSKGMRVWAPARNRVFSAGKKVISLSCGKDGSPLYDVVTMPPVVNDKESERSYGCLDMFKKLYGYLFDAFSSEYDIVLYEYDWRKSQFDVACELDAFIDSSGYSGVVFIAHSMGGNITSYYLSLGKAQRKKVIKHISIGTPYLGCEKLVYSFDTGDAVDNYPNIGRFVIPFDLASILDNEIRAVVPNFSSAYDLVPLNYHFLPFLNIKIPWETRIIDTHTDTVDILSLHLKNWNGALYKKAVSNQERLFRHGKHVTKFVDSYYIVGDDVNTPETMQISLNAKMLKYRKLLAGKTKEGDGMVTLHSALIGNTVTKNVMFKYNMKGVSKADHVSLVDGSDDCKTFDFIRDVIRGVDVFGLRKNDFFERYSGFKMRHGFADIAQSVLDEVRANRSGKTKRS